MASDADQQGARALAQQLVDDARAEAESLREAARAEVARVRRDSEQLAGRIVQDARIEAERMRARPARGDGALDEVIGGVLRATLPGAAIGELVAIDRRGGPPLAAEIVALRGEQAVLAPLGELAGIAAASPVRRGAGPLAIRCGEDLLGRVLDGLGEPLDGGPALTGEPWPIDRPPPPALLRPAIAAPQPTGIRAIDGLFTLGRGHRAGLFGRAGAGASSWIDHIARGATADAIVLCAIGERGGELAARLADLAPARHRIAAVCATRDAPPQVRLRAIHTATAIAEWFRDRCGAAVVLLCDSLTEVARAHREIALAIGEPAARDGLPPSALPALARLIERTGATPKGAITAIYAARTGDDQGAGLGCGPGGGLGGGPGGGLADPIDAAVARELRAAVDAELTLDLADGRTGRTGEQTGELDVIASRSREMHRVVAADHAAAAARVRARLAIFALRRAAGPHATVDPLGDDAARAGPAIQQWLNQRREEIADWDTSLTALLTLAGPG
jgi:type III secretion protein N (ATPase)